MRNARLVLSAALAARVLAPSTAGADDYAVIFTSALKLDLELHEHGGITMMRADGSGMRKLSDFATLNYAFKLHGIDLPDDHASCSPDGRRIVFSSSRETGAFGNDFQIFTMNPNGSDVVRLTNVAGRNIAPAWSPDGSKIAFASERDGGTLHIFVMNADGSGVRQLTSGSDPESEPAWSPDSARIVFTRIPFSPLGLAFTQKDLYVMNADGSGVRKLTDTLGEDHDASFSPDGTRVAFSTERTAVPNPPFGDTFVIDVSKGTADKGINLTDDLAFGAGDPSWSPDNRIVFFKALLPVLTSPMQIWTMSADGSNKQHVTHSLPDGLLNIHPSWCKLRDGDGDGRPDYQENANRSYYQASILPIQLVQDSRFGAAAALADLTHDGRPDVVIGAPDDDLGSTADAGRIFLMRGSAEGPDLTDDGGLPSSLTAGSAGGASQAKGRFGQSLVGCDFNGDGFSDLAVGAPGQNQVFLALGKAGPFVVLSGSGEFGAALAAADFNDDGRCDLAVGAPSEVRGAIKGPASGAVRVFYGSASGVNPSPQVIDQDLLPLPDGVGGAEAGDRFGAALAAGRLQATGPAALAIGAPGEGIDGVPQAGVVHLIPGGAQLALASALSRDARSIASPFNALQAQGAFGEALAMGHFSGSLGPSDLVVGAPHHDVSGLADAGLLVTYSSSAFAFSLAAAGRPLTAASLGGSLQAGARLGQALAVGDLSGDARHDLAASAPGQTLAGAAQAGQVFLVLGSAGGTSTTTTTQACSGTVCAQLPTSTISGTTSPFLGGLATATASRIDQTQVGELIEAGDLFGGALAAGDLDGDGQDDLLIGSASERLADMPSGLLSVRYGLKVGVSKLAPAEATASAGETVTYELSWRHPERWRALSTLHLRLSNDRGTALWLRFDEARNALGVLDDASGEFVEGSPGEPRLLAGSGAELDLARSAVEGSGPDGPSVTLRLPVRLGLASAGQRYRVELLATDDRGHTQGFDEVGSLHSAPVPWEAHGGCQSSAGRGEGWGLLAALAAWARRRRTRAGLGRDTKGLRCRRAQGR